MNCQHHEMAKTPDIEFGKRLEELIETSHLSGLGQNVIAKKFKVSEPMITHYKRGEKIPSMGTAIRIAKELGCCVEYLLTGRGPRRITEIPEEQDKILDIGLLDKTSQSHIEALFHSMLNSQNKRGNGSTKN